MFVLCSRFIFDKWIYTYVIYSKVASKVFHHKELHYESGETCVKYDQSFVVHYTFF